MFFKSKLYKENFFPVVMATIIGLAVHFPSKATDKDCEEFLLSTYTIQPIQKTGYLQLWEYFDRLAAIKSDCEVLPLSECTTQPSAMEIRSAQIRDNMNQFLDAKGNLICDWKEPLYSKYGIQPNAEPRYAQLEEYLDRLAATKEEWLSSLREAALWEVHKGKPLAPQDHKNYRELMMSMPEIFLSEKPNEEPVIEVPFYNNADSEPSQVKYINIHTIRKYDHTLARGRHEYLAQNKWLLNKYDECLSRSPSSIFPIMSLSEYEMRILNMIKFCPNLIFNETINEEKINFLNKGVAEIQKMRTSLTKEMYQNKSLSELEHCLNSQGIPTELNPLILGSVIAVQEKL